MTEPADPVETSPGESGPEAADLVEDETLVEEISIDGMCGVY
ncbi:MAG: mycofactocin precursor MftA [Carbonactinosporaceae bacterium]